MKVLGLTGAIGSGKSTVAMIFSTLGVPVYNSDERAKELYFAPEVQRQVVALLGPEAYLAPDKLNKDHIRKKIFSDAGLLKKINQVIHPAVKKDFNDFKKLHAEAAYLVKESALLFEAGIAQSVDKILLVTTSPGLRTERLKKRDKLSEAEIERILASQMPDDEKSKLAHWVIENNEEKLLIPQALKIHEAF